MSDMTIGNSS